MKDVPPKSPEEPISNFCTTPNSILAPQFDIPIANRPPIQNIQHAASSAPHDAPDFSHSSLAQTNALANNLGSERPGVHNCHEGSNRIEQDERTRILGTPIMTPNNHRIHSHRKIEVSENSCIKIHKMNKTPTEASMLLNNSIKHRQKEQMVSRRGKKIELKNKIIRLSKGISSACREVKAFGKNIHNSSKAKKKYVELSHLCNLLRKVGRKAELHLIDELIESVDFVLSNITKEESFRSGLNAKFDISNYEKSLDMLLKPKFARDLNMTLNYSFARTSKYCKALSRYENEAVMRKDNNISRSMLIATKLIRIADYADSNRLTKLASRCRRRGNMILSILESSLPLESAQEFLDSQIDKCYTHQKSPKYLSQIPKPHASLLTQPPFYICLECSNHRQHFNSLMGNQMLSSMQNASNNPTNGYYNHFGYNLSHQLFQSENIQQNNSIRNPAIPVVSHVRRQLVTNILNSDQNSHPSITNLDLTPESISRNLIQQNNDYIRSNHINRSLSLNRRVFIEPSTSECSSGVRSSSSERSSSLDNYDINLDDLDSEDMALMADIDDLCSDIRESEIDEHESCDANNGEIEISNQNNTFF